MRGLYFFLLILYGVSFISAHAQDDKMPIIAYMGIPDWHTNEEDFKTLSECGFNVSLYPYQSLEQLVKACRYAEKYGVKIIARCPEMEKSPQKTAYILKKEKGFGGYIIQDEPSVPDIILRQKEINRLKSVDDSHCFYINLQPFYRQDWVESNTKVKTYPEYLKVAAATPCQQLSFDHYPITTKGVRKTWYHNLEMVREESINSGKPFWAFVLSVSHDVPYTPNTYYPMPTLGSLRLQAYSNLAYGAQGIQYFTYWTPGKSENYNYHDAPISYNGMKTKTYYLVKQMNSELRSIASLFYHAKIISVKHLGTLPEGTTRLKTIPENLRLLKIIGRMGAIVSQIHKNGHLYLAIVNKNHKETMKVKIKVNNKIPKHLTKELSTERIKPLYIVEPGDILLFMLK